MPIAYIAHPWHIESSFLFLFKFFHFYSNSHKLYHFLCSTRFFIFVWSISLFSFIAFIHYYYFSLHIVMVPPLELLLLMSFFHFLKHLQEFFFLYALRLKVNAWELWLFYQMITWHPILDCWLKVHVMVLSCIISSFITILICWWQRKLEIESRFKIPFGIWISLWLNMKIQNVLNIYESLDKLVCK